MPGKVIKVLVEPGQTVEAAAGVVPGIGVAAPVARVGQGELHLLAVYQQSAAAMGDFMDFTVLVEDERGACFQCVAFGGRGIDLDLFFV